MIKGGAVAGPTAVLPAVAAVGVSVNTVGDVEDAVGVRGNVGG